MKTERIQTAARSSDEKMFHHPVAFWLGTGLIISGVLFHFPDYIQSGEMNYIMVGMTMSGLMLIGMGLIVGGTGLAAFGLFPRRTATGRSDGGAVSRGEVHTRALDDAPLTANHWRLILVCGITLVIDTMKPATLGFVVPGSMSEYGLTTTQAAMYPLSALSGTTVGSICWGMLADRAGRRNAILMSAMMFIGTSICGFMPSFGWNLFMCFLMGAAVGGLLPIVFALLAETMPVKHRGWVMVLIGGLGTAGGYLAASLSASLLEHTFSWRILWIMGLPTGTLIIGLNRFIPESPRFLLGQGRFREARRVMEGFGIRLGQETLTDGIVPGSHGERSFGVSPLFRGAFRGRTISLVLLGTAWGLVNWGFITWFPTMLRQMGLEMVVSNGILARSALIAVPGAFLVAWLYTQWSSKKTIVLFAMTTALILTGFAVLNNFVLGNQGLLVLLIVGLLVSSGGVISTLAPYSTEVYPTSLRGKGAGMAAASSKVGGILGPWLVASVVGLWPGLTVPALLVAAPISVAALILAMNGIETRGRRLEEIHPAAVPSIIGKDVQESPAVRN